MISATALGPEGWGPSRNVHACNRCGHAKYQHQRLGRAPRQSLGACQRTDCACAEYAQKEAATAAMSLRAVLDAQMTEAALQEAVRQMALTFGWLYYHTHDSRHSAEGFPDCVLAKAPRLIVAELKSQKGVVSREQTRWGGELSGCEVEYYVFRPSDWSSGEIERILSRS